MRVWAIAALGASMLLGAAASGLALPEDGIAPIEQYTSAKAKRLASTYNTQLLKSPSRCTTASRGWLW